MNPKVHLVMHITIPSSTNDDRNPHWYLLYTYSTAVLVVLVLHIYGEWLQTQSLLISFFHLDSFSPLDLNLRSSSNDVHRDPLGLSLLRKEALYPPRALFAQIANQHSSIPLCRSRMDLIPIEQYVEYPQPLRQQYAYAWQQQPTLSGEITKKIQFAR